MVIIVIFAILKSLLSSVADTGCGGQIVAILVALGLFFAIKIFTGDSTSSDSYESSTPPFIPPIMVVIDGQKYVGLNSMPMGVRNAFIESLAESARLFPDSFSQRLTILNRPDLAAEFRAFLSTHKTGSNQEALDAQIRKTLEKFEAGRFYERPVRDNNAQEEQRQAEESSMLTEARQQLALGLITPQDYEATQRQINKKNTSNLTRREALPAAAYTPPDELKPIPDEAPLLQPERLFSFEEYQEFMREGNQAWWEAVRANQNYPSAGASVVFGNVKQRLAALLDEYPSRLPVYLLARCPICGGRVSEAVDTFSLNGFGWNNERQEPSGRGWLGATRLSDRFFHPTITYQSECQHAQLMLYGVNLNGQEQFENLCWSAIFIGSERPSVIPLLLERPDTFAVIHSLPLGKIADGQWKPHYTIYFTTYFTTRPPAFPYILKSYRTPEKNPIPRISPYEDADYNLLPWVQRGHLFWLNPAEPHLPLDSDPNAFPYSNIQGREGRCYLKMNKQGTYDLVSLKPFQDGWFGY